MNAWKSAALAAALVSAAALGSAFLPPAHAQTPARVQTPAKAPRALEIFGGRGSQIGITIRDVEESDAKTGKMTAPSGVVIEDVTEESPAAKAGLKKGDIVVEFDGERVRSVRQFSRLVQETPPGRKTQASVMRDGQRVTVTVEPRDTDAFNIVAGAKNLEVLRDFGGDFRFDIPRPAAPVPPSAPKPPAPPAFPDFDNFVWRSGNSLGITVGELSDQLAQYFGTKDGVLVTSVADNSAAAKAGVKAGDVITSFNGSGVSGPSDLRRRIQRLEDGEDFSVGVVRDKKSLTLKGKAESSRPRRTYRQLSKTASAV
jgi:serine protease Do